MQRLIDDLLTYSRAGVEPVNPEPTDMGDVLRQAQSHLAAEIRASGAQVTSDTLPSVTVDREQITQLMLSILGNAIKFRGEKRPVIHVSAKKTATEWVISVADNGIGIEAEFLPDLFDLFRRMQPRDKYPGTGLGLAVARRIVERHGGRIWAQSEPWKGSTFYFSLPDRPSGGVN
jgi:light-regulated signal transduction histidine kinase (bacteriophytochrome)